MKDTDASLLERSGDGKLICGTRTTCDITRTRRSYFSGDISRTVKKTEICTTRPLNFAHGSQQSTQVSQLQGSDNLCTAIVVLFSPCEVDWLVLFTECLDLSIYSLLVNRCPQWPCLQNCNKLTTGLSGVTSQITHIRPS